MKDEKVKNPKAGIVYLYSSVHLLEQGNIIEINNIPFVVIEITSGQGNVELGCFKHALTRWDDLPIPRIRWFD